MHGLRCGFVRAAVLVGVAGWSVPALAGEPNCDVFISAVPYTINAQGHYCLANNVATAATSGAAITINANSVVLDLRGYKIGGQAAGIATATNGVYVTNQSTVVIRNGLIRGFYAGVFFSGGPDNNNNVVEDINADSNTLSGIYVGSPGANNTVRRCVVGNTGGTTLDTIAVGIYAASSNSLVLDNSVTGTGPSAGGMVYYGIFTNDYGRVVNNQVIGNGAAGTFNYCFGFGPGVIYKDNVASRCGTEYFGGTPVGTTNHP